VRTIRVNKVGRFATASVLAFGSLIWSVPASSQDVEEPVVIVVTTPGGDDSSYQVPLTTTITFDGIEYDSVYVTTNSVITFGQPDGTYWDYPQTPSISLYSMDWVVFPWSREDEHLTIAASDGGFQVDISARPIWLQNAEEPTNINIVAGINTDGTVSISYSLTGPTYDGQTRTGVRLTNGDVVTLEEYGVVQVEEPPVLSPEPVEPTPEPSPEPTESPTVSPEPTEPPTASPEPSPTESPTASPEPEPTESPSPEPEPEPTESPEIVPPFVPEGATIINEGGFIDVVAPEGQRILSVIAWYGDPSDSTRGVDVSSTLTELASGETSITIESSNIYGDPAPGTVKVLIVIVEYEDVPQPELTPEPIPTDEPTIEPSPEPVDPTPVPSPEPSPEMTPEPQPTPEPEQTPNPESTPEPTPEPEIVDTPEPTPIPTPIVEPTPEPSLEPVVTPQPQLEPTSTPTPTPQPSQSVPEPTPTITPTPTPNPEPNPSPVPEPEITTPEEVTSDTPISDAISVIEDIPPTSLTQEQAAALVDIAMATFETAEPGSEEYEQALELLLVAAQQDDIIIDEELASAPVIGAAVVAVADAINAIGNAGADMSPQVREQSEKVVVASVIVANIAITATAAATSAAAVAARRP
jgi:hypothetical protein